MVVRREQNKSQASQQAEPREKQVLAKHEGNQPKNKRGSLTCLLWINGASEALQSRPRTPPVRLGRGRNPTANPNRTRTPNGPSAKYFECDDRRQASALLGRFGQRAARRLSLLSRPAYQTDQLTSASAPSRALWFVCLSRRLKPLGCCWPSPTRAAAKKKQHDDPSGMVCSASIPPQATHSSDTSAPTHTRMQHSTGPTQVDAPLLLAGRR